MAKKAIDNKTDKPAQPELNVEFANRLRDPFETNYMGVLRTNDPLLLERGNGSVELYRDLRRDGKVFSGLQKRQLALVGKSWQVEPRVQNDAKASKDAETVTTILKGFAFDKLCSELLQALLSGFAVAEIVWTVRDDLIVPERVVTRAQRRFVYVQDDENSPARLQLLTRENMLKGIPVPERKFIVHRVNPEDDNPYGTGLGLQLFWPVFFKRKGIVAWNKLNDRFGSPTPHGRYPRNASPKEKSTLEQALRAFSNDGYVATPEGMDISLLESKLSGNVTTQQALCEYMDDWIRGAHRPGARALRRRCAGRCQQGAPVRAPGLDAGRQRPAQRNPEHVAHPVDLRVQRSGRLPRVSADQGRGRPEDAGRGSQGSFGHGLRAERRRYAG